MIWIRTQDREDLIKADAIGISQGYERSDNNFYLHGGETWLGNYRNKKQALKVLDMIENEILNSEDKMTHIVFKMPKEEDM